MLERGSQQGAEFVRGLGDLGEPQVGAVRALTRDPLHLHPRRGQPDQLRGDENIVQFVQEFDREGKPIAAICHGPWVLVEAGTTRGRTLTSWPTLQTDIRNAGGNWVDEEVVVDNGLVSSRKPDDLPAFCDKLAEEICEGIHSPA